MQDNQVRRRRLRGIAARHTGRSAPQRQLTAREIGDLLQEAIRITEETTWQLSRNNHHHHHHTTSTADTTTTEMQGSFHRHQARPSHLPKQEDAIHKEDMS